MIRFDTFADEISQNPIEQVEVLSTHGIKHIEFRAIHGTNVLDLSDEQHTEFRDLLRARGFGLTRSGRRSARSGSRSRSTTTCNGSIAQCFGRVLRGSPNPNLQLLHAAWR